VRTSAFPVLRMSWTTLSVAMINGVYCGQKVKKSSDEMKVAREIAFRYGRALIRGNLRCVGSGSGVSLRRAMRPTCASKGQSAEESI
jgi:hypothetical protein